MVARTTPRPINVNLDNATEGQLLRVFNETTNELLPVPVAVNEDGNAIVDAGNFPSGWSTGDVIKIETNGRYFGGGTITLTASGVLDLAITTTDDTSVAVSI